MLGGRLNPENLRIYFYANPKEKTLFNALELLMLVLAFAVMATGLSRRWRLPAQKRTAGQRADWASLLSMAFGQKRMLARPPVGLAHLSLTWGFIIFILIVLLAQTPLRLAAPGALVISLLLDISGLLMLVATVFLLIRRILRTNTKADLRPPKWSLPPLLFLLIILLSGLFAEGARLNLVASQSIWAAPVGWLFASFLPESPSFMQAMLRVHFVFVVLFILSAPFTFMRHIASTSVHLLYKEKNPVQPPSPVNLDQGPFGAATVVDLSAQQLREAEACVSCSRCNEQCPALISGKPLAPSLIMGKIADQMQACPRAGHKSPGNALPKLADSISADEIWACTTCMACVAHCPVNIRPMDKLIELRRNLVLQQGNLPAEAIATIRNLELYGDVNGKGPARKPDWALNRDVAHVSSSSTAQVLLWVGCSGAFHPEHQQTTRDLVKLLKAGGVDFGILAHKELCCGDPARKLGDEALFQKLAQHNVEQFQKHHISKIVTLCPHCFNTLGNEYQALGCNVEVLTAIEMVAQLIKDSRISLKYPLAKSIAVHDPCYLGRYNGIYEPLREVCQSVPGVTLKELDRNRRHGFCCGGGGGRMWLHENIGEKINLLRAKEVIASGVNEIATACPYCQTMLEDGIKAVGDENQPKVVNIIRLAADSLG